MLTLGIHKNVFLTLSTSHSVLPFFNNVIRRLLPMIESSNGWSSIFSSICSLVWVFKHGINPKKYTTDESFSLFSSPASKNQKSADWYENECKNQVMSYCFSKLLCISNTASDQLKKSLSHFNLMLSTLKIYSWSPF